jgi:hypothetical protein
MVDPSEPTPARDVAPLGRVAEDPRSPSAQQPWKRSKRRQAFAGDIAVAELRNRPTLAPDRLPVPPPPVATPKFTSAGRFVGVAVVAAAGFSGYWWVSTRPAFTLHREFTHRQQFTLPSDRADLASEQRASAYFSNANLNAELPSVPPPANATPPISPPVRTDATEAAAPPQESTLSSTSLRREPPPAIQHEDRERALRLKQKGDEQLAEGLVAPARLLYEKAADLGLAEAALALAATYDEMAPAHSHLRGVGSDLKAAAHWYERARLLNARNTEQQVQTLGKN